MRSIDADELKKAICNNRDISSNAVCDVLDIIDNFPTVDMDERDADAFETGYIKGICEQRPQGEWKGKGIERICSECGFDVPVSKFKLCKFCPNCGASMVKGGAE